MVAYDYQQFEQAIGVIGRQVGCFGRLSAYASGNCSVQDSVGLMLRPILGSYIEAVTHGIEAVSSGQEITTSIQQKLSASVQAIAQQDADSASQLATLNGSLSANLQCFPTVSAAPLGSATTMVSSDYYDRPASGGAPNTDKWSWGPADWTKSALDTVGGKKKSVIEELYDRTLGKYPTFSGGGSGVLGKDPSDYAFGGLVSGTKDRMWQGVMGSYFSHQDAKSSLPAGTSLSLFNDARSQRFQSAYEQTHLPTRRAVAGAIGNESSLHGRPNSLFDSTSTTPLSKGLGAAGGLLKDTYGAVSGVTGVYSGVVSFADTVKRSDRVLSAGGYGDHSLDASNIQVSSGSVTQLYDPSANLRALSSTQGQFASTLRSSAGLLIGGLDWLYEKIMGYSFLEKYVFKPLVGDWDKLDVAGQAWACLGDAMRDVGRNFEALPRQMSGWEGEGYTAFAAAMADTSQKFYDFTDGCKSLSDVTVGVMQLAQAVGELIGTVLSLVGDFLSRLAVEAAIPVFGWVAGAIDGAAAAVQLAGKARQIASAIDRFVKIAEKITKVLKVIKKATTILKAALKAMKNMANLEIATTGAGYASQRFDGVHAGY